MNQTLIHGDCLFELPKLAPNSISTIITDPPYGLEFMGKEWDRGIPGVSFWQAALRVAKPGAFLLAFGGTRTHHRLACAIEDAGWEIRDCMMWLYGTGFPKSLDISKAIDKAAGAERERIGTRDSYRPTANENRDPAGFQDRSDGALTLPATDLARQWSGWGTALKPAWEPIIVATKPMDGTFANNAVVHGVAGLNIDGARIETADDLNGGAYAKDGNRQTMPGDSRIGAALGMLQPGKTADRDYQQPAGRWPANVVLDEEAGEFLDAQAGIISGGDQRLFQGGFRPGGFGNVGTENGDGKPCGPLYADKGGPSRFFYCAKASKSERGAGNNHPTVKPLKLMEYLCNLTKTPTGGVVLDMFMGSNTTGLAARNTGRDFIGIEKDAESFEIAKNRVPTPGNAGTTPLKSAA